MLRERRVIKTYTGEMVLPKNAVIMKEEEMRYVEGGAKVHVNMAKLKQGLKKYGIKVNAVGVFTTATCAMIKYNSRNAYTKRIRKGSQGWFNVVYGATKADRKFADKLCRVISLNGVLTFY